jgi:hypothetical protein
MAERRESLKTLPYKILLRGRRRRASGQHARVHRAILKTLLRKRGKSRSRRGYLGRSLGLYALSGRGLIRNRGASGGGTLCRGAPQLLQCSCCVPSTRNQCPRAGHSGLKHCTVQPGRYCIALPDLIPGLAPLRTPIAPVAAREIRRRCRDCERGSLVCQEVSLQLVVVQFQSGPESNWGRSLVAGVTVGIKRKGRAALRRTPLWNRGYSPQGSSRERLVSEISRRQRPRRPSHSPFKSTAGRRAAGALPASSPPA